MVFVFPQNRIVIAIVLLIYIYRLSHWATLCVVGTGKNFSSCLRNTEKDQAQIHQRFLHQSQISNGNFSFKQHFCRKCSFLLKGWSTNMKYVLILKYCNCALENWGLFVFLLLSSMAGAALAQTSAGPLADRICYPGSGLSRDPSREAQPDPEQTLQAVANWARMAVRDRRKITHKNKTKIQIIGIKYPISAFYWKPHARKGRWIPLPPCLQVKIPFTIPH